MYDTTISKSSAFEFFRYLAKAYVKINYREREINKVDNHMQKLKDLSKTKNISNKKLAKQLEKLEHQIEHVVLIEKKIFSQTPKKDLNKEVKLAISLIDEKLNKFISIIKKKQTRLVELKNNQEKKDTVDDRLTNVKSIELKNKLYDLEEKYDVFKHKEIDKKKLAVIKKKIDIIRDKL